jgi:hypothetical protein
LQPNHSSEYETANTTNPYLVQIYEVKIDGIPQERGAWIVELEGEGLTSRAFIRKGAMAGITSINTAGTELKFYDENGSQVKNFKIWMEGRSHSIESSFNIPFG